MEAVGGLLRSPLRDIVVGKIRGEWKKIQGGRKNIFKCFAFSRKTLRSLEKLCILSQNFCVPSRTLRSPRKTFAFSSQRYLRSLAKLKKKKIFTRESKRFCEGTQISLRENEKFCEGTQISLRENAKFCEGTQSFLEGTQKFCERTQNIWKIFFPPTLNFFHSLWFFPTTMSFKGLRSL